jgi:hypothetical protein
MKMDSTCILTMEAYKYILLWRMICGPRIGFIENAERNFGLIAMCCGNLTPPCLIYQILRRK